jgi:hypothetical protein
MKQALSLSLMLLFSLPAAMAQDPAPAAIPPTVFRFDGSALATLVPLGPSTDFIEVLVSTANPKTDAVRVTLTYLFQNAKVVAVSERPITNGFDIHSFAVPSYQVPILSVNVKELVVASDQTYTGY